MNTGFTPTVDELTRLQNELCAALHFRRNNRNPDNACAVEGAVPYWTNRAKNAVLKLREYRKQQKIQRLQIEMDDPKATQVRLMDICSELRALGVEVAGPDDDRLADAWADGREMLRGGNL